MNRATKITTPRIMSNIIVFQPCDDIEEVKRDAFKRGLHACIEISVKDPSYLAIVKIFENELKTMAGVEEESRWPARLKKKVLDFLLLISDQE